MCWLVVKPAGKVVPKNFLENGVESNPDRWGIAWRPKPGAEPQVIKGDSPKDFVSVAFGLQDYEAILHTRFATSGNVDDENTHPIEIRNQVDGKPIYLAHNGIITEFTDLASKFSDTYLLARTLEESKELDSLLALRAFRRRLKKRIGKFNKLAFMSSERTAIINEGQGIWKDGVWYSNTNGFTSSYTAGRSYYGYSGGMTGNAQYDREMENWEYDDFEGWKYKPLEGGGLMVRNEMYSQEPSTDEGAEALLAEWLQHRPFVSEDDVLEGICQDPEAAARAIVMLVKKIP